MNFRIWHLLVRGGFLVVMPMLLGGFLMPAGGLQAVLRITGIASAVILGLTGAVLAILIMAGRFRFSCPGCGQKQTHVLWSRSGGKVDLMCEQCGIFRETGPFKLKLRLEPHTDENGNPSIAHMRE